MRLLLSQVGTYEDSIPSLLLVKTAIVDQDLFIAMVRILPFTFISNRQKNARATYLPI